MRFETNEFYLKSAAEMRRLFNGELPDAMDNTLRVAEMCDVRLDYTGLRLPHFPVPAGETAESWLRSECERGIADRYPTVTDEVRHRLEYELGIIGRMGYSGYFLIVADFIRFARERGIMTDLPRQRRRAASSPTRSASRRSTRSPTACRSSASSTRTG